MNQKTSCTKNPGERFEPATEDIEKVVRFVKSTIKRGKKPNGVELVCSTNGLGNWNFRVEGDFSAGNYLYSHRATVNVYRNSETKEVAKKVKELWKNRSFFS